MDLGFEQMLAAHNQDFKEAEVFDNWMPPVGDYIVSIIKLDCGQGSKNDPDLGWWKLTCRIEDVQDAELNGKEFTVFYSTKALGILKGTARVISGNGSLNDLTEAHAALEAAVGQVARVEILTTTAKNGKDYKNCYFREIINTTVEASADMVATEVPAQEIPTEIPAEVPPVV